MRRNILFRGIHLHGSTDTDYIDLSPRFRALYMRNLYQPLFSLSRLAKSAAMMLTHHPSSDAQPSSEDFAVYLSTCLFDYLYIC